MLKRMNLAKLGQAIDQETNFNELTKLLTTYKQRILSSENLQEKSIKKWVKLASTISDIQVEYPILIRDAFILGIKDTKWDMIARKCLLEAKDVAEIIKIWHQIPGDSRVKEESLDNLPGWKNTGKATLSDISKLNVFPGSARHRMDVWIKWKKMSEEMVSGCSSIYDFALYHKDVHPEVVWSYYRAWDDLSMKLSREVDHILTARRIVANSREGSESRTIAENICFNYSLEELKDAGDDIESVLETSARSFGPAKFEVAKKLVELCNCEEDAEKYAWTIVGNYPDLKTQLMEKLVRIHYT